LAPHKIFFASDFHLGVPDHAGSLEREKRICSWLDSIRHETAELFLVGDLFDFWYEYRYTIPKGSVRLQGKIAEFTDSGIPVHFFVGNHDLWMKDYFITELGVTIHHEPVKRRFGGKTFYIGHGDGLGPGDRSYKLLRRIFASPACQWLFSRLHPNLAFAIARRSSRRSRAITGHEDREFLGEEKEWLYQFAKQHLQKEKIDYFIFGHRHLPLNMPLPGGARYVNLGDWITYNTFAEFDGADLHLREYAPGKPGRT
jgi:UDP-2,3-diacylglucosamine hydrolase